MASIYFFMYASIEKSGVSRWKFDSKGLGTSLRGEEGRSGGRDVVVVIIHTEIIIINEGRNKPRSM